MKKILFFIICFFVFPFSIFALGGKVENSFLKFDYNSDRINELYHVNNTVIPKKFDLTDKYELNVYNQRGDTCQLYSLVSCMDSNVLLTSNKKMNISHGYLDFMTSFMFLGSRDFHGEFDINRGLDLISLKGFVTQDEVPDALAPISPDAYGFIGEIKPKQIVDEYVIFPSFDDLSENEIDNWLNIMKLHIMKYGAVSIRVLSMDYNDYEYYNMDNNSFYYDKSIESEKLKDVIFHAVSIVGWDDNYSKDNFNKKPKKDGAFKCINSWGSDWGENGFFYISYYDAEMMSGNKFGIISTKESDYSNIYSTSPNWLRISILSDEENQSAPSDAPTETKKKYYLIKYDREEYNEYLKAISIYLSNYKNVKFYVSTKGDSEDINDFKYIGELNVGDNNDRLDTYVTLNIDDDILLSKNKFFVLLEYEQEGFKYTFTNEDGNYLTSGNTLEKDNLKDS